MKTAPKVTLSTLRDLDREKPSKRIELVRSAWPQIESAIQRGHTLKRIHKGLVACGIRISYSLLTVYVKLIRLENRVARDQDPKNTAAPVRNATLAPPPALVPAQRTESLQSIESQGLVEEFEYSGFLKEGVPNFTKLVQRIN